MSKPTSAFEGHQHDTSLFLRHENGDCLVAFGAGHVALVLDVRNAVFGQIGGDQGKAPGPLGNEEGLDRKLNSRYRLESVNNAPSLRGWSSGA